MKKIFTVVMVALGLAAGTASAQTKIGYISIDNMVGLMPEAAKADSALQKYQVDSLNPQLALDLQNYQYKDSIMRSSDTLKMPQQIKDENRKSIAESAYRINNWQSITQQLSQQKQEELVAPIYTKVYDAIKAVAKEKGYTHVFSQDVFLVAPEGDNLLPSVAAKLKVKLPTAPGAKPAGVK